MFVYILCLSDIFLPLLIFEIHYFIVSSICQWPMIWNMHVYVHFENSESLNLCVALWFFFIYKLLVLIVFCISILLFYMNQNYNIFHTLYTFTCIGIVIACIFICCFSFVIMKKYIYSFKNNFWGIKVLLNTYLYFQNICYVIFVIFSFYSWSNVKSFCIIFTFTVLDKMNGYFRPEKVLSLYPWIDIKHFLQFIVI